MQAATQTVQMTSKKRIVAGRVLSGIAILFLVLDGIGKLVKPPAVVEGTKSLGYPESTILGIGITLLVCTIAYAIPRTSILGAILLTGYLGGAVATHVRVGNPLFTHVLFPIYLGVFIWAGLYWRETKVRALIPFRG
ncbi:MAG TPA: DoxX family protein [Terriglobales bacterium]|nr:DoxX family protein [Terriglobales bacterium]